MADGIDEFFYDNEGPLLYRCIDRLNVIISAIPRPEDLEILPNAYPSFTELPWRIFFIENPDAYFAWYVFDSAPSST